MMIMMNHNLTSGTSRGAGWRTSPSVAWCEEPGAPKTIGLHKRTCRPYALIPRGRRPYHPSLKGTEDPRDVAKQNGSVAGGTRVATLPEGAGV